MDPSSESNYASSSNNPESLQESHGKTLFNLKIKETDSFILFLVAFKPPPRSSHQQYVDSLAAKRLGEEVSQVTFINY